MDPKKRKAVEKRLDKIAKLHGGRLTPDDVVEDAKSTKSPLHACFEWDDGEAARQYRLEQARGLIRSVKYEHRTETTVISTVRYVRDPQAGEEQGYVETVRLTSEQDLARAALDIELKRLGASIERARGIAVVLGLESEFTKLMESFEHVASAAARAAG